MKIKSIVTEKKALNMNLNIGIGLIFTALTYSVLCSKKFVENIDSNKKICFPKILIHIHNYVDYERL